MTAIAGTRRQYKEMSDGTLRVSIDIDPQYKAQFLHLFGAIDMPVALAPLIADFEQKEINAQPEVKPASEKKLGELCRWAVMRCKEPEFQAWMSKTFSGAIEGENVDAYCRQVIIVSCGIKSRTELDSDPHAASLFHTLIREPFSRRNDR